MSLKTDIKNHYLGKVKKDYEVTEYKATSPTSPIALETLMGKTLEQVRGMSTRIENFMRKGKVDNPMHYQHFKSAAKLFSVEAALTTVASSKLVVTPKISGVGISLYYLWNESQRIYAFHRAKLDDPSAVSILTKEELDITDKIKYLNTLFANLDHKTIPAYVHGATLDEHGIALIREGLENPKYLCVQTVLTIPLLDTLGCELSMSQLLRGWIHAPNEMMKAAYPKFHFVAYNLKASSGYLSTEPLALKGTASANRKVFTLTKRTILSTLGHCGFHTIIQSVDSDRLVRGMVLGVEHASLETYIVPALQSIRETNKRVSALKSDKTIAAFKKTTLNRNDDLINVFNYLRNYPYKVEGLVIQPNYFMVAKALEEEIDCDIYLTPASTNRLADRSSMEIMKVLDLTFDEAQTIIQVTGYDGTKSPLTKANIKLLKKEGIEITDIMVVKFQNSIDNIRRIRERTESATLVKSRDQLWDLELRGAVI